MVQSATLTLKITSGEGSLNASRAGLSGSFDIHVSDDGKTLTITTHDDGNNRDAYDILNSLLRGDNFNAANNPNGISITPDPDYDGAIGISWTLSDNGNFGGDALTDSGSFTVDVTPVNDAPAFGWGETAAPLSEADDQTGSSQLRIKTGQLLFSDADVGEIPHVVSVVPGTTDNPGGAFLGTFTAWLGRETHTPTDERGQVLWKLEAADSSLDFLAKGQVITQTYLVTVKDASGVTATITVTAEIKGSNDGPVISVPSGDSDYVEISETDTSLTTSGTLSVTDVDLTDVVNAEVVAASADGAGVENLFTEDQLKAFFKLVSTEVIDGNSTAGTIAWEFDTDGEAFDFLPHGHQTILSYTIEVSDGNGGTAQHVIDIKITGTNDAPVVTGDSAGSVTEDTTPTATGTLDVADPDANQSGTIVASGTTAYGTWSIDADGNWTYTLDNDHADVQGLNVGDTLDDSFTIETIDGTPQIVSITIHGKNDAIAPMANDDALRIKADNGTIFSLPEIALLWNDASHGEDASITDIVAQQGNFVPGLDDGQVTLQVQGSSRDYTYTVTNGGGTDTADIAVVRTSDLSTGVDDDFIVYLQQAVNVQGGLGDDILVARNASANVLFGDGVHETADDGDDLLIGADNASNALHGGGGNDMLIAGNGGSNALYGGSGDDILVGGSGGNTMTGGDGDDTFVIDTSALLDGNLVDIITDYNEQGDDVIDLSDLLQAALGREATADDVTALVDKDVSGGDTVLSVDRNGGSGETDFVEVARLEGYTGTVSILYDDDAGTSTPVA